MSLQRILPIFMLLMLTCVTPLRANQETWLHLMRHGQATSFIQHQKDASPAVDRAIEEFQYHFERATGLRLPERRESDTAPAPDNHVRILFGDGPDTRAAQLPRVRLASEAYRLYTGDGQLIFLGADREQGSIDPPDSPATQWAVHHFLDRYLGVRWLWPGHVGTHVPRHTDIAIEPFDIAHRPALEQRRLRILGLIRRQLPDGVPSLVTDPQHQQMVQEAVAWQQRHQMGTRSRMRFGHAFRGWWEKYHESRPEILAQPPAGLPQSFSGVERRVKLCVSNPRTTETVIEEWQAAGAPNNWNVSENDGSPGFCTCESCLAWDGHPDAPQATIWAGGSHGLNFTGRYIRFWNQLLEQMRPINPNITLSSYAYSFYSNPPSDGFRFHPGMVLGIVDSYDAKGYESWQGWYDTGARMFLRPNWWHTGAMAPVLPLHATGDYFRFALHHGMLGFDFDSLMGYWGTQGPVYYLVARLSQRPDLSVNEILAEYASAFGSAAPVIARYLQYWENFTEQAGYTIVGGGGSDSVAQTDAPYERLLREKGLPTAAMIGGWASLPLLYTDAVLAEANGLLDQAQQALQHHEAEAAERITFLRDGLRHLELARDVIALAYPQLRPPHATRADFLEKAQALQQLRTELSPRHVVWGEELYLAEHRRHAPTLESRLGVAGNPLDWE